MLNKINSEEQFSKVTMSIHLTAGGIRPFTCSQVASICCRYLNLSHSDSEVVAHSGVSVDLLLVKL